ncbi:MAG: S46 family peptidase [Prolixibacteraceae bacterium]|nr:S46 family peptidase [Prolixibacteraceae bacterium]
MQKILFLIAALQLACSIFAREGMWLPILLDKNIEEMQQMGFTLSPDDIYQVNQASLKDAVVLFGGGCTGEIISPDGLLITNHHCGFGQIQSHSTLENDYLTNGFWAMNQSEELPNDGLTVSILVEMRDVTQNILAGTDSLITDYAINEKIRENSAIVVDEAIDGTHYKGSVKSLYSRNQYFLFIYEVFKDVRLVGAPPSAIGKFGGDTDNWMWPRHTGDFSMFRIYADSTNKPAAYSPENVPYQPRKYLPINISGINEGDFTMVFGYPATTMLNLHSLAVQQIIEQRNPDRIAIRDLKLDIMGRAMEADRGIRIQYAAKYNSTSNAWKKWQGEINGLKRMNAVETKQEQEATFKAWIEADENRQYKYGSVLKEFERLYAEIAPYQKVKDYYDETINRGTDSYKIYRYFSGIDSYTDQEKITSYLNKHFKDYHPKVDAKVFVALFNKLYKDIDHEFLPGEFVKLMKKKTALEKLEQFYHKSMLNNEHKLTKLIENNTIKGITRKIEHDPLYKIFEAFNQHHDVTIAAEYNRLTRSINQNQTDYLAALLEKNQDKMIFPDANQTLRVTYGKVEGYEPADGVSYKHYTTIDGIISKDNPDIYDYAVPEQLKKLWENKEYGRYANENGELPVCFVASNHTTGGNSGSPVLNKDGQLIGINFDRCWEGTMSDVMFDPEKCRNISLDMRYMLFIIDKFAGAGYLLDEMEIIQ